MAVNWDDKDFFGGNDNWDDDEFFSSQARTGPVPLRSLRKKPEPVKPEGVGVSDYGKALYSGAVQGIGGWGEISEQVLGVGEDVRDWANTKADTITVGMSPAAQASMQKELFSSEEGEILGEGAGDINAWGLKLANTLGMQADIMLPGGVITKIGRKALGVGSKALAAKVKAKVATGMTDQVARNLVAKEAKLKLTAAAMVGYGSAEAAVSAGATAVDVRNQVAGMPEEILAASPEYTAALDQFGNDKAQARAYVAEQAATAAAQGVALPTFLLGAVAGKFYDDIFRGVTKGGRLTSAGKGALTESMQEAPQSAAEEYLAQSAVQKYADPSIDPSKGVIASTLEGAALGGGVGGIYGGAGHRTQPPAALPEPIPNFTPTHVTPDGEPVMQASDNGAPIPGLYVDEYGQAVELNNATPLPPDTGSQASPATQPGPPVATPTIQPRQTPQQVAAVQPGAAAAPPAPIQQPPVNRLPFESLPNGVITGPVPGIDVPPASQMPLQGPYIDPQGPQQRQGIIFNRMPDDISPLLVAASSPAQPPPSKPAPPVTGVPTPRAYAEQAETIQEEAAAQPAAPEIGILEQDPMAGPEQPTGPKTPFNKPSLDNIDSAANEAAASLENDRPEPTDPQKEQGNYKKGPVTSKEIPWMTGLTVMVENPAGTKRNPEWPALKNHYGYFQRSKGYDGDEVDVFLGNATDDTDIYVIDQVHPKTRAPDEHKVVMMAGSEDAAKAIYDANYSKDWNGFSGIGKYSFDEFKKKLNSHYFKNSTPGRKEKKSPFKKRVEDPYAGPEQPASLPAPAKEETTKPERQYPERDTAITPAEFIPTHETSDGTPVAPNIEDGTQVPGEWLDAAGDIIEDDNATPIEAAVPEPDRPKKKPDTITESPAPAGVSGSEEVGNAEPKNEPAKKTESTETKRARLDLDKALADLGDILLDQNTLQVVPVDEAKLLPVLTRVLDAAFRLGYHKFKDSATFALDTIRAKLGDEAADAITLDHLQGSYIGMAGKYDESDTKKAVVSFDTLAEVLGRQTPPEYANIEVGTEQTEAAQNDLPEDAGRENEALDTAGTETIAEPGGLQTSGPGRGQPSVVVEGEQPANVPAAGKGEAEPGVRGGTAGGAGGGTRQPGTRGVPANGRGGTGGAELVHGTGRETAEPGGIGVLEGDAGTGRTPAGEETVYNDLPLTENFHYENPLEIVGGGQVARFKKNQKAIELYHDIQFENRHPTLEEQKTLAGYTGWGSFGQELFKGTWAIPNPKEGWEARDAWLRDHLGQKEWESAQRSITNSHYTDPPTVMAMWDMVHRMGFDGGRVLEPAMGIGNFFGMMPSELKNRSELTGIELDELTGNMAKMLYPHANINIKGYQESKTPDNFYDLVIGNWPFENTPIADRKYNRLNPFVHDYFWLKALDQVRPGGLVVGITSKGTLDKVDKNIRLALAKKAELVAAFRLPSGAFQSYAGTKVVTDIVILKKRPAKLGIVTEADNWIESKVWKTTGEDVRVNEYYHDNPDNVVGTIDFGHGTTFGRAGLIVHRPDDMPAELARIKAMVPEGTYQPFDPSEHIKHITNNTDDRQRSLVHNDQGFFVVLGEHLAKASDIRPYTIKSPAANRKREAQLEQLIELRTLYSGLIESERSGTNKEANENRNALKKSYDFFVEAHGNLNSSFGLKYMKAIHDPSYVVLSALENNTGTKKAPDWVESQILTKSTARSKADINNPTVSDAFVIARNQSVHPTVTEISKIAGKPESEVKAELIKSGAVFEVLGGDIEPSDIYLSGNVREKLREAKAHVTDGHTNLQRNVTALEKVIPADIPYHEIEARMGATWMVSDIYRTFIAEMLNLSGQESGQVEVSYNVGRWKVRFPSNFNYKTEASTGYGTRYLAFNRLINAAMSNQSIQIKGKDSDGKVFVDEEATKEVAARTSAIREGFTEWVWKDPERRVELEHEYNESRNAWASPEYDGSFLTFEGMALQFGDKPFNLRQHQVDAIWRAIVNRRSLNAHEVGTGKTFTIGGIAVESRRYGIARKPLILAHNANSAQVADEIRQMYPAAKVLYIDNLSPSTIKVKLQQIANDDWDAVVMPHSLIDRLSLKEETLMGMAAEDIAALEREAREAAEDAGVEFTDEMLTDTKELKKLRSPTAKDLVKSRNTLIENIRKQAQRSSREDAIAFEDLGIDMLMVDEVHVFKKPTIVTKMRMKGLNTETSARSISLQFLARYIRANNDGKNVHTFSGTPITNTLAELYHQMRYIMEDDMADSSLDYWDGWFGSFASEVDDVELNAAAQYEAVTRLAAFINVPELRKMLGQYMDVVFSDAMPEMKPRKTESGKILSDKSLTALERAELVNGRTEGAEDRPYKKIITDTADMTPPQLSAFASIQRWATSWQQMKGKDRWEAMQSGDPESPIITEGLANKASFDTRLLDGIKNAHQEGKLADDPNSKASRVIKNVLEIYKSHEKATQVIFTETGIGQRVKRSTGHGESRREWTEPFFSTAKDIIERLVAAGFPRNEIALVTGSTSKERRKNIAKAMNRSEIRLVIGATSTLGIGVNMQKNLRALHHLDAPWMPGDLEQRNGRGHRQGNQWNTVLEYRYITDRLDGRRWQVLAIKQKFIKSFLSATDDNRTIEGDVADEEQDDILATFSEAAGDPRILIKEKIKKRIDRLHSKERLHTMAMADAIHAIRSTTARLKKGKETLLTDRDNAAYVAGIIENAAGDKFSSIIDGKTYTVRKEADAAIAKFIKDNVRNNGIKTDLGTIAGIDVSVVWDKLAPTPSLITSIAGDKVYFSPSVQSVFATLRHWLKLPAQTQARIAEHVKSLERLKVVSKGEFKLAPQLAKTQQDLADLEADMEANPVPPPAWLRQGSPVGSDVMWGGDIYTSEDYFLVDGVGWARSANKSDDDATMADGYGWVVPMAKQEEGAKKFLVTGHRWTPEGWFVLAEDEKGPVSIPYNEVKDEQGFTLYDEREFKAPEVIQHDETTDGPPDADAPRLSRKSPAFAGLSVYEVKKAILPRWKKMANRVPVQVVEGYEALPPEVYAKIQQEDVDVEGVAYKGTIYLVAPQITSAERAQVVMFEHELRHIGMRRMLGRRLMPILNQAWFGKETKKIKAFAKKVGIDTSTQKGKQEAVEEYAVSMAERGETNTLLQKIYALIRDVARGLGFDVEFSDVDLRQIVANAGTLMESGRGPVRGGVTRNDPVFQRAFHEDVNIQARFSRVPRTVSDSEQVLDQIDQSARSGLTAKQFIASKIDDWRPSWLATLTRGHLADIGKDNLPHIAAYTNTAQNMDADRSNLVHESAEVAKRWAVFASKFKREAEKLARLMHNATISGVDPAEEFKRLIDPRDAREKIQVLKQKARGRSAEGYIFVREIKEIEKQIAFDRKRLAKYPGLSNEYTSLSPEAKAIYKEVRDFYAKRFDAVQEALLDQIRRAKLSQSEKRAKVKKMRELFESQTVQAPYFPLARFGDFWVTASRIENGDKVREFHMFENSRMQELFAKQMANRGWKVTRGKKLENIKAISGASEGFVADVVSILDEVGGSQAERVKDSIYQLYLSTLPDLSLRKNFIHRQSTKGFSNDALRAFAKTSFHGSYQLAKLRYSDIMEEQLSSMKESITKAKDPNKASDLFQELQKRHEWAMNPTSGAAANVATQIGFAWYLGVTPSAAIVNMTQTPLVAYPVLAAKYGWGRAGKALTAAMKDYMAGGFNVDKSSAVKTERGGDTLKAIKQLVNDGVIDKTLAHDLISQSETSSAIYNPTASKVMNGIAFLFHHAERFNREVTALAAYRLSRDKGLSHNNSVAEARNIVYESHFDYSNANKARFMQSDTARVFLMFRQFSLNMTYLLARNLQQTFAGESAEVRSIAKRKLAGILGMHAMAAGTMGLPLFWVVEGVLNAIFDDEDDPWEFNTEYRNFLVDYFGKKAGNAMAVGPIQEYTDVGIHSRVSLDELWFRSSDRDLEGKALIGYWLEQFAGPLAGIFMGMGRGYDLIKEGKVARGIEASVPKSIRDGMRMLRYEAEGVRTLKGNQILDDVSGWQSFLQGIGFVPGELAKQYDANRSLKNIEQKLLRRRQNLMNRFALAAFANDKDERESVTKEIQQFNKKNPTIRITGTTIRRSLKKRKQNRLRAEHGVLLDKRLRGLKDRARFASNQT